MFRSSHLSVLWHVNIQQDERLSKAFSVRRCVSIASHRAFLIQPSLMLFFLNRLNWYQRFCTDIFSWRISPVEDYRGTLEGRIWIDGTLRKVLPKFCSFDFRRRRLCEFSKSCFSSSLISPFKTIFIHYLTRNSLITYLYQNWINIPSHHFLSILFKQQIHDDEYHIDLLPPSVLYHPQLLRHTYDKAKSFLYIKDKLHIDDWDQNDDSNKDERRKICW